MVVGELAAMRKTYRYHKADTITSMQTKSDVRDCWLGLGGDERRDEAARQQRAHSAEYVSELRFWVDHRGNLHDIILCSCGRLCFYSLETGEIFDYCRCPVCLTMR